MSEKLLQLKHEFHKGEQEMARLDRQRQLLRDTMLRISGAIQVLEEMQASIPIAPPTEQPALSASA